MLIYLTENDPEIMLLKELRQLVECQFGLLHVLLSSGVINEEMFTDIRVQTNVFIQNDRLLDALRKRGRLKNNAKFLEALCQTCQALIKSLILYNGGRILINY